MTEADNVLSEQAAIDKIVAELIAKELLAASQQAELEKAIGSHSMKPQDWRWLAEKAILLEERQRANPA